MARSSGRWANGPDAPVLLLGRDERAHLAAFLATALRLDDQAPVRVQRRGGVVGVFASPPLGTMAFLAVPQAPSDALDEPVDRTVSAARLRDVLGTVEPGGAAARRVVLPDVWGPTPVLVTLPPATGWTAAYRGLAGDVRPQVESQVSAFRERLGGGLVLDPQSDADTVWDTTGWGGLPLRVLHTALLFGLLGHAGARVESATSGPWKRLVSPGGQVFLPPSGDTGRFALSVVR